MGDRDRATLAKARKELEEMYMGVPDESVNLTFQDFAQVKQKKSSPSPAMEPVNESTPKDLEKNPSILSKLPSLDFTKGLQASFQSSNNHHNYNQDHRDISPRFLHHHRLPEQGGSLSPRVHAFGRDHHVNAHSHQNHHNNQHHLHHGDERSMMYDDMSHVSGMSVAYGLERGATRRRPGIPHSNICTVCCNYIYIFRHRCLVCGRAYCRQCLRIGMGEMTEGRKCIECLGRRFSQRYIQKAGNVGCCMGYPSTMKQQELKWAEKGPRRSGENRYGKQSMMVSRSRSPVSRSRPTTPTSTRPHSPSGPPSFVMSSSYTTPYSPTGHHQLPF